MTIFAIVLLSFILPVFLAGIPFSVTPGESFSYVLQAFRDDQTIPAFPRIKMVTSFSNFGFIAPNCKLGLSFRFLVDTKFYSVQNIWLDYPSSLKNGTVIDTYVDPCLFSILHIPINDGTFLKGNVLLSSPCNITGNIWFDMKFEPTEFPLPFVSYLNNTEIYLTLQEEHSGGARIWLKSQNGMDRLSDHFGALIAATGSKNNCPSSNNQPDEVIVFKIPESTEMDVTLPYRDLWYINLGYIGSRSPVHSFLFNVTALPISPSPPPQETFDVGIIVGWSVWFVIMVIVVLVVIYRRHNSKYIALK